MSVSDVSRTKIAEVTLNALRTRQSLVKGERLVRHEMRAVLPTLFEVEGGRKSVGAHGGTHTSQVKRYDSQFCSLLQWF